MAEPKYTDEENEALRDKVALSWVIDEYFEGLTSDQLAARELWLDACAENRRAFELAQETWSHLTHSDTLTGLKLAGNDDPDAIKQLDLPISSASLGGKETYDAGSTISMLPKVLAAVGAISLLCVGAAFLIQYF